jgi:hypothetical protein
MVVVGLVAGAIFILAFLVFQHLFNFSARIVGDVCIDQVFMRNEYNFIGCDNEKFLVPNVSEWIVRDALLYGIAMGADRDRYFLIRIEDSSVILFESRQEFSHRLDELELPSYSISDSENMAHLLYGAGRNRVFPTEEGCCVPWRR